MTNLNTLFVEATASAEAAHHKIGKADASIRSVTYDAVGRILAFAIMATKDDDTKKDAIKLMNSRGVMWAKEGKNIVLPMIQAIDGFEVNGRTMKFNGGSIPAWERRKKLDKYAGAIALAMEEGETAETLETWLETFGEKHTKINSKGETVHYPNRLQGAMQYATDKADKPRKMVKDYILVEAAKREPQAEIATPEGAGEGRRFFLVLACDDGSGARKFLDEVEDSERTAQNYAKRLVEASE